MSGITNGLFGGGKGLDFEAQAADLQKPATTAQADEQYQAVLNSQAQQQQLNQQLAAQGGIQNQTDVYNQFGQIASGQINPAQAQLNMNTQANIANQAALMAGQRGVGTNPALIARQAAMQGAGLQQNAIGQAAALQANNQMNAIGAQGNIANQQVAQQQAGQNIYNQQTMGTHSNILGAIGSQNQAAVGNASQQNNANASIAQQAAQMQGDIFKGVTSGAGKAAMGMPMAEGGQVKAPQSHWGKHFAQGGSIKADVPAMVSPGEKYLEPKDVQKVAKGANPMTVGETIPGKPKVGGAKDSYQNDFVKAVLQEGGIVLPRSVTQAKDAPAKAKKFVQDILKQNKAKRDK